MHASFRCSTDSRFLAAIADSIDMRKSFTGIPEKPRNFAGVLNSCKPKSAIVLVVGTIVGGLWVINGDWGSNGEGGALLVLGGE